jgi:DNA-binding PucR family transcriptional regulator
MGSEGQMRDLVIRFIEDPDWLPSVSRDITDAIHAELPDLDADPELRGSTYASTDNVLRLLVDLSRSSLPPQEAVLPPAAVDYAREFVRRGLPLDSLLRAYHIGQATFFARWSERAHADISDAGELAEAIELGAKWTFEYVAALSGGLARRYAEERERWVRSAAALRAQVVDALLSGETVDIDASSRRLGYELDRDHLAFVVWSDAWTDRGEQALAMLERAALEIVGLLGTTGPLLVTRAQLCVSGWVGWRGKRRIKSEPVRLDRRAFPEVLVGFGSPGHGISGFCRSHREAMYARRVAQLTHRRAGSITRYDDVALAALASADVEHAREFVATELGPLAAGDDHSRRLTATLRVYLEENMSPLRAAHRLGVHENTITNRIRAAQELLPHPIERRSPELQVALRLLTVAQDGQPPRSGADAT